jgi:hypothetical protein
MAPDVALTSELASSFPHSAKVLLPQKVQPDSVLLNQWHEQPYKQTRN